MTKQFTSRRAFLKGMSAGALGLGAGLTLPNIMSAYAQEATPEATAQAGGYVPRPTAFTRLDVGDYEVFVINDGFVEFDATFFAANIEPELAYSTLEERNLPSPTAVGSLNIAVVRAGNHLVLFDTGIGLLSLVPGTPPVGGGLDATLALLGITPADITDVVISHFHPDHIGNISDGTTIAYPNAMYFFPQGDYDFLQSGPVGNQQVDDLIGLANAFLAPISAADQLTIYSGEDELLPGIAAVPAPGHSPGHSAMLINREGASLLATFDTSTHAVLSLEHPDWHMGFDAIPELAVQTRRAIFQRAADEKLQVLSYHFPSPGLGYVDPAGDGFQFIPSI